MAIFVTVMASVTLLFNSAIRTTKQGFLNQDAFEIARGAMDILERDLSRSFTSRDHGDVYNFYGTPIGFTFVGMITADQSSDPNLARVTYVMYHVPTSMQNIAGAVSIYENVNGIEVPTYNLIRYIEPGKEDLESFPVIWDATITTDNFVVNLQTEIDQMVSLSPSCDPDDSGCREELEKALKRELWIRMLSGGDDEVPSAWWTGGSGGLDAFIGLDPIDFAVAENIRHPLRLPPLPTAGGIVLDETAQNAPGFPRILASDTANFDPAQGRVPFFTYREFGTRRRRDSRGIFVPLRDPLTGDLMFADPPSNFIQLYETEVAPIELRYWNDTRNIAYMQFRENEILNDGLDNDGDGFIDLLGADGQAGTGDEDPDEADGINLGSPLDARPPVEIAVNFTLFFPSPYPGAPDFNRKFTMRIDLPTGYRRTFETPVAPAL